MSAEKRFRIYDAMSSNPETLDRESRTLRQRMAGWPLSDHSYVVRAGGVGWHVQRLGAGPALLLVHGTGASTHSWRGLMPLMARHFHVIAVDLPGHAFSEKPPTGRLSLPAMAQSLAKLLLSIDVEPALVCGHSAGAAVLCRMCLDGSIDPACLFSINGALLPFEGMAGKTYGPVARLLALNPLLPYMVAFRARIEKASLRKLITATGSKLDPEGQSLYGKLARQPRHIASALGMMSRWDLNSLERALPQITQQVVLVAASDDGLVKPSDADRAAALLSSSEVVHLEGLGHVAHEEDPHTIASLILERASNLGVAREMH